MRQGARRTSGSTRGSRATPHRGDSALCAAVKAPAGRDKRSQWSRDLPEAGSLPSGAASRLAGMPIDTLLRRSTTDAILADAATASRPRCPICAAAPGAGLGGAPEGKASRARRCPRCRGGGRRRGAGRARVLLQVLSRVAGRVAQSPCHTSRHLVASGHTAPGKPRRRSPRTQRQPLRCAQAAPGAQHQVRVSRCRASKRGHPSEARRCDKWPTCCKQKSSFRGRPQPACRCLGGTLCRAPRTGRGPGLLAVASASRAPRPVPSLRGAASRNRETRCPALPGRERRPREPANPVPGGVPVRAPRLPAPDSLTQRQDQKSDLCFVPGACAARCPSQDCSALLAECSRPGRCRVAPAVVRTTLWPPGRAPLSFGPPAEKPNLR